MNLSAHTSSQRENPVDVVERLADGNAWTFERLDEDELSLTVSGGWTDYSVAFTWLGAMEALHLGCAFDFRCPPARRAEILELIALANEQMWLGHFDLWPLDGVVMFRHSLLLSGGASPSGAQCEAILSQAVAACERYYQAFQFVVWAGKSAREALDSLMLDTQGEA